MEVFLSLGSNLGNREEYLEKARNDIERSIGSIVQVSQLYETTPWGFESELDFLNQVILVNSQLKPIKLLHQIHQIEKNHFRERNGKGYQARTLDIDILYYGDQIYISRELTIPHKHLHERNFVLTPLNELAPDFVHPLLNLPTSELLRQCTDAEEVRTFKPALK